jgi:hypothetical protein
MMKVALGLKLQTSTPSGSSDNVFDVVTAQAIAELRMTLNTFTEHTDPLHGHTYDSLRFKPPHIIY